jgi:hypothetical protein
MIAEEFKTNIGYVDVKTIDTLLPTAHHTTPDNGGLRDDTGKPRYDLIPPEAIEALADHYAKGAEKYDDRNWERGMNWGRCFRALMSHAIKWQKGEIFDEDPKMPGYLAHHMIAVAWNAIALYTYYVRNIGVNDVQTKKPVFSNTSWVANPITNPIKITNEVQNEIK